MKLANQQIVTGLVTQTWVWLRRSWECFDKLGLLGADRAHLKKKRKNIFSRRLAKLMKRALN